MQAWGKVKAAAKYAGVSERTFREWLKIGLIHSRLPSGTILVRFDDIDSYLVKFQTSSNEVEKLTRGLLRNIK